MKTATFSLNLRDEQLPLLPLAPHEVNLLLVFGERSSLEDPYLPGKLRVWFPKAEIAGGEAVIPDGANGSLQGLALSFDKAQVESIYRGLAPGEDPWKAGWETGRRIDADDLKVVLLFGAGSAEVRRAVAQGMLEALSPCPPLVCPELTGDALSMGEIVLSSSGLFRKGFLAVGIFGNRIEVGQTGFRGSEGLAPRRGKKGVSFPEQVLSIFKTAA